jgi:hypothetical protein
MAHCLLFETRCFFLTIYYYSSLSQ